MSTLEIVGIVVFVFALFHCIIIPGICGANRRKWEKYDKQNEKTSEKQETED